MPIQTYHLSQSIPAHIKYVLTGVYYWEPLTTCKVTYRYYLGMLSFLNEDYTKVRAHLATGVTETRLSSMQSEQELTLAFYHCYIPAHSNQE